MFLVSFIAVDGTVFPCPPGHTSLSTDTIGECMYVVPNTDLFANINFLLNKISKSACVCVQEKNVSAVLFFVFSTDLGKNATTNIAVYFLLTKHNLTEKMA